MDHAGQVHVVGLQLNGENRAAVFPVCLPVAENAVESRNVGLFDHDLGTACCIGHQTFIPGMFSEALSLNCHEKLECVNVCKT